MKREYSITRGVLTVAIAQGLVALIAGLSIFPLVFSYGLEPTQGPGLIFVTLPVAFGQMPYGSIFGTLLFLLLSFAALTATIVLQEPIVAALEEYTKWSRRALAYASGFIIWLMGIVTVLSFNYWSDVHPLRWIGIDSNKTPFDVIDYLTSNLMMPLGGLMVALIAGWALSRDAVRDELGLGDGTAFRLWYAATRYLVPIAILIIFWSVL
jgi:NSS family neurotransmitter:Na+ symporter